MTAAAINPRLERAAHLRVQRIGPDRHQVTGGSAPHVVTAHGGVADHCDCADFSRRGGRACKHILAVRIATATEAERVSIAVLLGVR